MKYSKHGYKRNSKDKNNPYNVIPSGNITMEGVDFPVYGVDNLGNEEIMMPGGEYVFPGNEVFEVPLAQIGGAVNSAYDKHPFEKFAESQGMSVEEALQIVLSNAQSYPPEIINAARDYELEMQRRNPVNDKQDESAYSVKEQQALPKAQDGKEKSDYQMRIETLKEYNQMSEHYRYLENMYGKEWQGNKEGIDKYWGNLEKDPYWKIWSDIKNAKDYRMHNRTGLWKDYNGFYDFRDQAIEWNKNQKIKEESKKEIETVEKENLTYPIKEPVRNVGDPYRDYWNYGNITEDSVTSKQSGITFPKWININGNIVPYDPNIHGGEEYGYYKKHGGSLPKAQDGIHGRLQDYQIKKDLGQLKNQEQAFDLTKPTSHILDILSIPGNLMAEGLEGIAGYGDKKFNFSDAMPGFSGDMSFKNWHGEPIKNVANTIGIENPYAAFAVNLGTDPSTWVEAGLAKNLVKKG